MRYGVQPRKALKYQLKHLGANEPGAYNLKPLGALSYNINALLGS